MPLSPTFSTKKKDKNTDKLAINWQNFAGVRLKLKFAFIIRPLDLQLRAKFCFKFALTSSLF